MYPKGEKCSKVLSKIDDIFHDQEMKLILYFHLMRNLNNERNGSQKKKLERHTPLIQSSS